MQNGSRYDSGGTGAQFYDAFLLFTLFILQTKNYDTKNSDQKFEFLEWLSDEAWVKGSVLKLQRRNSHISEMVTSDMKLPYRIMK